MRYLSLALVLIVCAFTLPAVIKTEYKDYSDKRIDLSLQVRPYANSDLLLTWQPEDGTDILGYEVQRHNAKREFETIGFVPALRGNKSREYRFVASPDDFKEQVYRLKKIKTNKSEQLSREVSFNIQSAIPFHHLKALVKKRIVEISFMNDSSREVSMRVINASGQHVFTALPQWLDEGECKVVWNRKNNEGARVPAGIYIIELQSENGKNRTEIDLK